MLWYMLLSEELRVWEQRMGYWGARCQTCHRDCWQLTYRIWRTKGNGMSPATPWSFPPYGEAYQVRCQSCGIAAMVGHPQQWIPQLAGQFVYENHHPTVATPQYLNIAFPHMR
jgi:hypothetical protein